MVDKDRLTDTGSRLVNEIRQLAHAGATALEPLEPIMDKIGDKLMEFDKPFANDAIFDGAVWDMDRLIMEFQSIQRRFKRLETALHKADRGE